MIQHKSPKWIMSFVTILSIDLKDKVGFKRLTPSMHSLAKLGSWVFPLKPPKTEAAIPRPTNNSIG